VLCSASGQSGWFPPVGLAVRAPGCKPELGARLFGSGWRTYPAPIPALSQA
jgi:hypothetical protein